MDNSDNTKNVLDYFSTRTKYWKDIYSCAIESYDYFHRASVLKRKKHVLECVDRYSAGKPLRILDSGCGAGIIVEELVLRGHQVCGLDISPGMVQEASDLMKKHDPGKYSVRLGNVEKIEFPENSYDMALCIGVLQYLDVDEAAMKELARVTRPNGYIIVSIPNIAKTTALLDPHYYIFRGVPYLINRIFKTKKEVAGSASEDISKNRTFRNRRYSYGEIYRLGKRFGFQVCDVRPIGYGPLTMFRKEVFSRPFSLRIAERIENLASRRDLAFLKAVADRWVVVYRKVGNVENNPDR